MLAVFTRGRGEGKMFLIASPQLATQQAQLMASCVKELREAGNKPP